MPGDLYVLVRARPDPGFQRDGADLWLQEILLVTDAVLGSRLEVSALEGQPVRYCGSGTRAFPVSKGEERPLSAGEGPQKLDREERELYERLRALTDKPKRHFWEQGWTGIER